MMFVRGLISCQSLRVAVVAQQSIVEAFAALRRIRDRRAPDDETVVFDAGEVFEGFELGCELVFVGLGDFGAEFEEDLVCEFWLGFFGNEMWVEPVGGTVPTYVDDRHGSGW
jgi:hypothetical protein